MYKCANGFDSFENEVQIFIATCLYTSLIRNPFLKVWHTIISLALWQWADWVYLKTHGVHIFYLHLMVTLAWSGTLLLCPAARHISQLHEATGFHWKYRVVMMPTLSSLAAPQVVVTTTRGATTDDKVGIIIQLAMSTTCDVTGELGQKLASSKQ